MSIYIEFRCDGCEAKTEQTRMPQRRFESVNGKGWGFGHYHTDKIEDVVPDGWHAFDPFTGCCYCPTCWTEITESVDRPESETPLRS